MWSINSLNIFINKQFKNQQEICLFPTEWDMFSSEIEVDLLLLFGAFFIMIAQSVLYCAVPS